MRSGLYLGGSVLVGLLFGTAGCQSGGAPTVTAPEADEAAAARPLHPTARKNTRLNYTTEGLLKVMNPFVRAAICAVWSKVDATWNARDAERFSLHFADDASFRFVQRGHSLDGRTAILEHFRERFQHFAPDLRHRTQVSAIHAVASGAFAVDGEVEILRYGSGGDDAPTISRTFSIFAVMSGKDEDGSIRALRIYELSAADAGIGNACSDANEIRFRRPAAAVPPTAASRVCEVVGANFDSGKANSGTTTAARTGSRPCPSPDGARRLLNRACRLPRIRGTSRSRCRATR